jgi:guanylate kinase
MSSRGELFILSGPSGSGKTSLIRRLLDGKELDRLAFSVSHTTRGPRAGEVDGGDYHFVSRDAFDQMVEAGRFLEWARVHDHQYGTSLDEVMPRLADGIDVLPPTYEELKKRLLARNLDREEVIDRRLTVALQEIQSFVNYEYVIINHDIGAASRVLASIILEKRHRQGRMRDQVAVVLEGFHPTQSHT